MRVPFRQGIIIAPPSFLTLQGGSVSLILPPDVFLTATIADGPTNYLITEPRSVAGAWTGPFTTSTDYWLYWDIDTASGQKTYGYTTIEPVEGPTAPVTPVHSLNWFNTSTAQMFEYNSTSGRWIRKVRVFAAALYGGASFVSMSINSPDYAGTQAGLVGNTVAGSLVFDNNGFVIKKGDGTFFTTEDVVSTGIVSSTQVKLESIVLSGRATANIPAYSAVRFTDYYEIAPATNMLGEPGIYGIIERSVSAGEVVQVVREGIVSNPDWDWEVGVNQPVFVSPTGELTVIPQPSQAIGLVLSFDTILLTATVVDAVSLIESSVTIQQPPAGIAITGSTGPTSSSFNVTLTDDLAAVEHITTTGVVKRTGPNVWTADAVSLTQDVDGVLDTTHGGTGTAYLNGYVKGSSVVGAPLTASLTIPGADVVGDISGNAENVNGNVAIENGGTGADTREQAINNLLPDQTGAGAHMLVTNGTTVSWEPKAVGTVSSVGVVASSAGLTVTNSPITSSGNINISLAPNLSSLASLTTAGLLMRDVTGNVATTIVTSSDTTIRVTNGDGSISGGVDIQLPVVSIPGIYASVTVDDYGRVVNGSTTMSWTVIADRPNTIAGYGIVDAYTRTQTDALSWNWSAIINRPTTVTGYGIADVYTKTEVNALTWDWVKITATPTTLSGYGIADGIRNTGGVFGVGLGAAINRPAAGVAGRIYVDTTANTIAYDNGGSWVDIGNPGTVSSVTVASSTPGVVVSNGTVTSTGTINLSLGADLAAVEGISTLGYAVRTANNAWATRSILGTIGNITVTNSDGTIGNTSIDLVDVATPGTYFSVVVDSKGRVRSGTTTQAVAWNDITGRPTTVAGFGISDAVTTAQVGAANGVASLDANGRIPTSQMPPVAITDTHVVGSQAEMLTLTAQRGDVAIRIDLGKSFILTTDSPSFLSSWQELLAAGSGAGGGVTFVSATSSSPDLVISGGPIIDSGTLSFSLTGNLLGVSNLNTNGVVKLNGGVWSASAVNLSTEVTNTLPVFNGGTGSSTLTGYVRGNGISPMTASPTIPGADVAGDIPGSAANVTGTVAIANGGTGQTTRHGALDALLPPQTTNAVLVTNGATVSWSTAVSGSLITGTVPLAANALQLGGFPASQFITSTGIGATGTWDIDISGSATELGGLPASSYARTTGDNATGTWPISITGDAGTFGGIASSGYAKANGTDANGTWDISISGAAASVSGVVPVSNGGTGATNTIDALTNLLPSQTGNPGQVLTTNGTSAYWRNAEGGYSVIAYEQSDLFQREVLDFVGAGFALSDDPTRGMTRVQLATSLSEIASETWEGMETISIVGNITLGTWNGTTIAVNHGGTGATTQQGAANNILPPQTAQTGKVLSTDGSNVSWTTPTVAWTNVTSKPTTIAGYGITDAYTKTEVDNKTWAWSSITGKPTTLAGYGITDGPIKTATTQIIAASAFHEIDTWTAFGANTDARGLMVSVKVLDSDSSSPTFNMWINSESVATVAIRDQRYVRVFNDFTSSLDFHISIRQ